MVAAVFIRNSPGVSHGAGDAARTRCGTVGDKTHGGDGTIRDTNDVAVDTAVLNSVVNLPRALPFLARHATIHTFLDNDEAGRLTLERLRNALPGATVIDRAESYRAHKDLNESLRPSAKISRTPRRRGRKL